MLELPPILLSALTGFISGLLLSMPVGPVNLTIINEGARCGFKRAMLVGLGAATMDVTLRLKFGSIRSGIEFRLHSGFAP